MTPIKKDAIHEAMAAAKEATKEDLRGMYPMACRTLAETTQVLRDEVDRLETERAELLSSLEGVLPFVSGNYWVGIDAEADAVVAAATATARRISERVTSFKGPNVEVQGREAGLPAERPLQRSVGGLGS